MSVRRLAEPEVQPASFAFNEHFTAEAGRWIAKYPEGRQQSAIIPLLMLAQEQEGWVTKAAIEAVCDMLSMPYIRGLEVATFYTQFQLKPVGARAHIQVCGTTPCALRGAGELMDVCRSKIHPEQSHLNADGSLSWEEVECLGACVNAPMVMIFKDTYEDLTPERLAEIIDAFEAGRGSEIEPGPQVDRFRSAPQGGFVALQDEAAVLRTTRERDIGRGEQPVAPSNTAKPKTDARETDPAVKSPSPVKVAPTAEAAASVKAPRHSAANANKVSPEAEQSDRQRKSRAPATEPAPFVAPELGAGKPIGAAGKKAATGREKPSLEDKNRPAGIVRPEIVDDLKLISGIGPKNEAVLHSLGIFTFAQVAAWKKAERDWVDAYLNFHGRIEREDWVKQADALARGGVAEYMRVFGKKPV